jgi:flagellar hook-length control protein FliK
LNSATTIPVPATVSSPAPTAASPAHAAQGKSGKVGHFLDLLRKAASRVVRQQKKDLRREQVELAAMPHFVVKNEKNRLVTGERNALGATSLVRSRPTPRRGAPADGGALAAEKREAKTAPTAAETRKPEATKQAPAARAAEEGKPVVRQEVATPRQAVAPREGRTQSRSTAGAVEPRAELARADVGKELSSTAGPKEAPAAARTEGPRDLAELIRETVHDARFTTTRQGGKARLEVQDSELGRIKVAVEVEGKRVSGRLLVETPAAREALVENMKVLSEALASSGMELASFTVDVDAGRQYELKEMAARLFVSRGETEAEEPEAERAVYRMRPECLIDLVA